MKVRIIFANASEVLAERNGECFITDSKPVFPSDLSTVTVVSEDGEQMFYDAEPIECASVDGRYWFAFREPTAEARRQKELEDTIQMLTDCLLEMSEAVYA